MIMSYLIITVSFIAALSYLYELTKFGQGKKIDSLTIMFALIFTTMFFARIFIIELDYILYWKP